MCETPREKDIFCLDDSILWGSGNHSLNIGYDTHSKHSHSVSAVYVICI